MKPLLPIILIVLSCHILMAQDEKMKKELERLSWDWMNAWKAKDTVLLEKILAPDYRLLALINGELVSKTYQYKSVNEAGQLEEQCSIFWFQDFLPLIAS